MRLFCTFQTQIVFAYLSKNVILKEKIFFFTTTQKHYFLGFFEMFLFHCCHIFSLGLSNIKKFKNKKCTSFFFSNPLFWHLDNLQKNIFAPICVFLDTKKYKLERNKQKNLGQISTQPWTDFQLKKRQILDRFSTLQHIYIFREREGEGKKERKKEEEKERKRKRKRMREKDKQINSKGN